MIVMKPPPFATVPVPQLEEHVKKVLAMATLFVLCLSVPALGACKVCDGNGCKNAGVTEPGRLTCDATATGCTLSGDRCAGDGGGGGGCECGTPGCDPCNPVKCNENPFISAPQWELVSVTVVQPRAHHLVSWRGAELVLPPIAAR